MKEAYVALGANLGDREQSLNEAIRRLDAFEGIEVRRISDRYETDPVGYTDQPAFLNMAVAVGTELDPLALLRALLSIEQEMGRVREIRWGPRKIDLDLLLYENETLGTDELTLPHPRMGERAFVLVPLRDVWTPGEPFPWESSLAGDVMEREGIHRRAPQSEARPRKEL
ncbi:2-amino-4-hydroxy-6-hydroxymethyldihydropteridine diphosphokinase [Cohnella nanjingensis]|uniref:2-amino-4-hydroxy-6-hydroxymethyldihydropteridine diphosphokinase n=1 Tax=Cohnella nanjingensis TaxID=1387779 RepID=A0A7X0RLB9_9BACL|nr:2-amino-4-hydroxy-6-hydroxymethyldihydropteridine diphosphokinase [Cohnella nanjingensis]MBB6669603.1 2-amino-4-hydroxy-6-hydroxymethyldihydropteridine diphosphokinase [Cohnella nanjingensis]